MMEDKILEIVKDKFKTLKIDDITLELNDWVLVESRNIIDDDYLCLDMDTIIEWNEPDTIVVDKNVPIEREMSFETSDGFFCQVYTDMSYNINKMFLNID